MKNNLSATKDDLDKAVKKLATKEELKKEVAKLATKNELRVAVAKLATKDELVAVEKRLNEKIDGSERAVRAGTRLDIDERTKELEEKINLLPTKNEFFTQMDKLMKELLGMREEHAINGYRIKDHEDRIVILEQTAGLAVA